MSDLSSPTVPHHAFPRPPAPPASANPMLPQVHLLQRLHRENEDTFTLELAPAQGGTLSAFRPGQFNMVYSFGVGEVPISISGDPTKGGPMLHTIRAVGGVTQALCRLKKGAAVGLRGPYGTAWPVEKAAGMDVVIVAGGIGLAPLRPAIYHILNHRADYGRFVILYGARSPRDLLYPKELETWGGRFDVDVLVTVDHATGQWHGSVGVVPQLIKRSAFDSKQTIAMVCGPEIMMRFAARALLERGLEEESVWLSMERNMKCAVGFCGHCQLGPHFICKDGAVFSLPQIAPYWDVREL